MWGNNQFGQIDIFKKETSYLTPKIISLEQSIKDFRVIARGDYSLILLNERIDPAKLEMEQQSKEDIFQIINELSGKACLSICRVINFG